MHQKTYSPAVRAWAARKAREARRRAQALRAEHLPSSEWRRIRGKMRALDSLRHEAERLERIAGTGGDEYCGPF